MQNLIEGFKTLHPAVQVVLLVGIFTVLIVIAYNHSGEQNLMDLLFILYALRTGKSIPHPVKEAPIEK